MATIVDLKYKDNQGVIQTVEADADYIMEMANIPEEFEHSIKMIDDASNTETTTFIGISPKR